MPWLDSLWVKNPWISMLRKPSWTPMGDFAMARQKERMSLMNSDYVLSEKEKANPRDFLSRFIEALAKDKNIPQW